MKRRKLSCSGILAIRILLSASMVWSQESIKNSTTNENTKKIQSPDTSSRVSNSPGDFTKLAYNNEKGVPYPAITPGPKVGYADAIKRAAARNLSVKVAEMEIEKAEADLKKAWGMLLPIVQGGLEYTHFDHEDSSDLIGSLAPIMGLTPEQIEEMNIGPLVTNPQEKVMTTLNAKVPLVNMEGWFTVRASQKGVEATALSIEKLKRKIALGTAQAWLMALSYKDLIDFTHSQVVTCTEQLRFTDANFKAGNRLRIDVVRAETDLVKAKQSMISAALSYEKARDTLGNLMGMKSELPIPFDSDRRSIEEALEKPNEQTPSKRVEVRTQEVRISAMENMLMATWMKFVPTLSVGGHYSYRFSEMPDMGSSDRSRWAIIASLTIPLYNHFRYGELDKRRAELKQAELELERIREDSKLEVRNAMNDYETSLTTIDVARTQMRLASEGLNLTLASYEVGTGDSLSVTNARQTYVTAQFNLTNVQLKSRLALLKLLYAMGEDLLKNETYYPEPR